MKRMYMILALAAATSATLPVLAMPVGLRTAVWGVSVSNRRTAVARLLPKTSNTAVIEEALGGFNDKAVEANIKNASEYEEFREWAIESGVRDYALTNSPTAWLSFAVGSPALVASPQAGDLTIDEATPITGSGKADFVFSLDKVAIGQNAQEARLKSVFSVVGGTDLDPSGFSESNLTFTLAPTGDGRVKATVTPKKDSGGNAPPSFFMRVKMK